MDSAIGCEWAYCEDPAKVNGIVSLYLEGIYIALFIKIFKKGERNAKNSYEGVSMVVSAGLE